ncbi:MAG: RNA-binding protein [Firmicutes bacterium]|nr:RNA-binding protein [Bacillota bacterium]
MEFKIAPEGVKLRDIDIWGDLYDAMERGNAVESVITGVRRPNGDNGETECWELAFENKPGITGFCSTPESGLPDGTPINDFVGQKIVGKIRRIEKKKSSVVLSRKDVVEGSINKLIGQLKIGEELNAMVRVVNKHLYVDIGGGVILRITQEKARKSNGVPLDVQYEVDSVIKVKVIALDRDKKSIEVEPVDPWKEHDYKRGEVLAGQVTNIRDNLAFVTVKPGIIGRVYYKKTDRYDLGDYIKLQVTDFNAEKRLLHMIVYDAGRINDRRRNIARKRAKKIKQKEGPANEIKTLGGFDSLETNSDSPPGGSVVDDE